MATIIDEREITITRELAYDIIKRNCDSNNSYDSKVFKRLEKLGYYYEDNKAFDIILRAIDNTTIESLLLDINPHT